MNRFQKISLSISRFTFFLSLLNSVAALLSHWAINAQGLGAQDLGLALFLAIGGSSSLVASFYAVPVLVLLAGATALAHRPAALWFLAAAGVSCIPLAILSLLE